MCGLAGSIYLNDKKAIIAKEFTQKAIKYIIHRGPDDNGIYVGDNACLGSCRLAINDLRELANMPMISVCKRYILVFNGEIFNFKELRENLKPEFNFKTNSDTEVIINYFKKYGDKCFDFFEGMFAIALWDIKKKELTLARDRFGKKPLFFKIEKDLVTFCSEIGPLVNAKSKNINLNKEFLDELAIFGEQSNKETVYVDIKRILPNKYLKINIKNNKFSFFYKNYYSLLNLKNSRNNQSRTNIYNILIESIKKRLISDRPIGIALSGGIDSAALCKLIHESGLPKPPAFTIRFNKDDDEVKRAIKIAKKYNLEHHIFDYKNDETYFFNLLHKIGEPYCDPGIAYLSFICKSLKKEIKVLITGDGGDEAFLGYPKYSYSYYYNLIPNLIRDISFSYPIELINSENKIIRLISNRIHISQVYSSPNMRDLEMNLISFLKPFISQKSISYLNKIISVRSDRYFLPKEDFELYKNYCIHDIKTRLPGRYLPKVDLAGSFNSMEIRSPYLDDLLISVNLNSILKGNHSLLKKRFLKNLLLEDFPKSFVNAKKRGFSPSKFIMSKSLIENSLYNLRKKNLSLTINELSDTFLKNQALRKHWHSKSIIWNLICINAWHSFKDK